MKFSNVRLILSKIMRCPLMGAWKQEQSVIQTGFCEGGSLRECPFRGPLLHYQNISSSK